MRLSFGAMGDDVCTDDTGCVIIMTARVQGDTLLPSILQPCGPSSPCPIISSGWITALPPPTCSQDSLVDMTVEAVKLPRVQSYLQDGVGWAHVSEMETKKMRAVCYWALRLL